MELISFLFGSIWAVMEKFSTAPLLVYLIPERFLSPFLGFLFFSSEHNWIHNFILVIVWLSIIFFVYDLFTTLLFWQAKYQCDLVEDRYRVNLFNVPIVVLYALGIIWPIVTSVGFLSTISWLQYLGILFPISVWIYYISQTGFKAVFVILRQVYVVCLGLLYITMMILPILISVLLLVFGISFWDSIETGGLKEYRTTTYYSDGSVDTQTRYY